MFLLVLALLVACVLCSWLLPDSALARSAARAFDTSVLLLGRGGDDDEVDDDAAAPPHVPRPAPRQRPPSTGARRDAAPTAARRRRITPFQGKKIAAAQGWRCACGCVDPDDPRRRGYLLDESYEIDHRIPPVDGGSNDESNLQALLRTHHQAKSSAFARGRPS